MNNAKINRSLAMREANALVKTAKLGRPDAMRKGTMLAKLFAIFATGAAASITFLKADGTIREAKALPKDVGEYLINGRGTNHTPTENVLFVDADLGAFRSFKKMNLLTVAA